MISIVTDSAAMLPADLRDRYDIRVVPILQRRPGTAGLATDVHNEMIATRGS